MEYAIAYRGAYAKTWRAIDDLHLVRITANAQASVREEPGCLRFDVMEDAQPNQCYYYEIYTDAAAFDAHKASAYFAQWRLLAEVCLVPDSQVNIFSNMVVSHDSEVTV